MCATFQIDKSIPDLTAFYEATLIKEFEWKKRIFPYSPAPVIVQEKGELILKPMNFSLIPSWSKEPKPKFATHNARIETIDEKATWKEPLKRRRCLVPITRFFEPIYEGDYGGHMVGFHLRDDDLLTAAGLWDEWLNKETGEVIQSFTIVTGDPTSFIAKIGHDRTPLFPSKDFWAEWISEKVVDPTQFKVKLKQNVLNDLLKFEVEKDRALKSASKKD